MFAKWIEEVNRFSFSPVDNGGVEINNDAYAALFSAHENGASIERDASGAPIAVWPDPMQLAVTNKIRDLSKSYTDEIQANIIFNGAIFQTDGDSRDLLSKVLSVGSLPDDFAWFDVSNNPMPMTYIQLQSFAKSILIRGQIAFVKLQKMKAQVRAAETVDDVVKIVW